MKNAKWMLPVTLLLLSGLMAAQSLSQSTVKAQVPFDFMVNNKIIPAGECEIGANGMSSPALVVRNVDAHKSALVLSSRQDNGWTADNTVLVFKQYGNQYFLSGIRLEGSNMTYQFPVTKAEAELRAHNASAEQTILLASVR